MLNAYKISLIIMIGLALLYVFQGYYPEFMSLFSDVSPPFIAFVAVLSSGLCLRKYWHSIKEKFSLIWLCFTLGVMFWFLGELGWTIYTRVLNIEIPYPSIADAFWLSGYIPFFIALYLYVKIFSSVLSRKMLVIALSIVLIITVCVSVTLMIPLLSTGEDLTTLTIDFAYPFLDLLLFSVALLGLFVFRQGQLGKSWLLINIGVLPDVTADILFSYTTAQETYYSGHPLELLYHFGYLFTFLAFYIHMKEL